jgi:lysophospholipase L1-like esterase
MNGVFKAVALLALTWALAATATASASGLQVSMGDSYSSGEGAPPYDAGTQFGAVLFGGNGCHRSELAWPRRLGVGELEHLACSGAKTVDFFKGQKRGRRAKKDGVSQLDRLARIAASQSISRVLVTIGGNDVGFSGIVGSCLSPRRLPFGSCLKEMGRREFPRLRGVVLPDVVAALVEVRAKSAGAEVLQVGYPDAIRPLPAELEKCGFWLDEKEREHLPKLEAALDATLATAARAAGAEYLSIRDVADGHGICNEDPWINRITPFTKAPKGLVHPNETGHEKIKDRVEEALQSGRGIVAPASPLPARCHPAEEVAVVVDDHRSTRETDPLHIRATALGELISAPASTARIFGAVEFGADVGPMSGPGLVGASRETMLKELEYLDGDGFESSGTAGGLDEALAASAKSQPSADARVLLVGKPTAAQFEPREEGAPRTYVIGLDAGTVDDGGLAVQAMSGLARQTGGVYFPLKRNSWDEPTAQMNRVPAVVDSIEALLDCPEALEP